MAGSADSWRGFASDNNSGVHPEILTAISKANVGHAVAYGDDPHTERALSKFREIFGPRSETFFVFNGTAANVLSMQALTRSFGAVICSATAHIHVDECGAPERILGSKLLAVQTSDGKLTPELVMRELHDIGNQHHVQPKIISIAQSTELGTVYRVSEIKALAELAHKNGIFLHMDGARLANAAVTLGTGFREMTERAGVDALSFGGTKNGLLTGEAVVFFDSTLSRDFKFLRKQGMQLASKMRFFAAQFEAYLSNDLWKRNAEHANQMAKRLAEKVLAIRGVEIAYPVESNGVFAKVPRKVIQPLQEKFFFYVWDESQSVVRWMTSFDTTEKDIDLFVETLSGALKQ